MQAPQGDDLLRADDRDEVVAAAALAAAGRVGGNGAGDLLAVDLAVAHRLRELVRLAVGVRGGAAAILAIGEAPVDAIAVGVVRDDEHASFAGRVGGSGEERQPDQAGQNGPHYGRPGLEKARPRARREGCREKLKWALTLRAAGNRGRGRPNWGGGRPKRRARALTARHPQLIVPPNARPRHHRRHLPHYYSLATIAGSAVYSHNLETQTDARPARPT